MKFARAQRRRPQPQTPPQPEPRAGLRCWAGRRMLCALALGSCAGWAGRGSWAGAHSTHTLPPSDALRILREYRRMDSGRVANAAGRCLRFSQASINALKQIRDGKGDGKDVARLRAHAANHLRWLRKELEDD